MNQVKWVNGVIKLIADERREALKAAKAVGEMDKAALTGKLSDEELRIILGRILIRLDALESK